MDILRQLKLKRYISNCKARIEEFEQKRSRSQAALVDAILTHNTASDEDVEYFNKYTVLIDRERHQMHVYEEELAKLKGKK
ncbi:MAG: hypothetical protein MJ236_01680 [Clostridia bacterium]|nr:hypothetical protein [Clostridia bacterium]